VTRADELRQRAREIEDHAWTIRFTNPTESRALTRLARELGEIATHLPSEPGNAQP
jgi:hypothetical protein